MYNPYPNPVSKTKGLLPYFKIRFLWRRQNLKNANLRRSNLKFWAKSLLVKLMHRSWKSLKCKQPLAYLTSWMETDCAPFLANLFLFSYEFRYLNKLLTRRKFSILNKFRRCARYIDDVLLINNDNFLKDHKHDIYPKN